MANSTKMSEEVTCEAIEFEIEDVNNNSKRPITPLQIKNNAKRVASDQTTLLDVLSCDDFRIMQKIFRYLSIRDVLSLTETSSSLNSLIEKTQFFPLNVRFTINDFMKKNNRSQLDSMMKDSKRRYHSFAIRAQRPGTEELGLLFKQEWKNVIINISRFKSSEEFVKYMTMFTSSVESLKLENASIGVVDLYLALYPTQLKNLTVVNCSLSVILPFVFGPFDALKTLILIDIKPGVDATQIWKAFGLFTELTTLILDAKTAKLFFKTNISTEAKFALKTLKIEAPDEDHICRNIDSFLVSQAANLEILYMESWKDAGTLKLIWARLLVLEQLSIVNKKGPMKFEASDEVELQPIELRNLIMDVPTSTIPNDFLEFLLKGICTPVETITIDAIIHVEALKSLNGAADLVTVNGQVLFYGYESEESSSSEQPAINIVEAILNDSVTCARSQDISDDSE